MDEALKNAVSDAQYWENRYKQGQDGWDIAGPAPALIDFVLEHINPQQSILIPGAGRAYEAEKLFQLGYTNLWVMDFAPQALRDFSLRFPHFPSHQLLESDFFKHTVQYDCILEQTFFCAINPDWRPEYVQKIHQLLKPKGHFAGLLFNRNFDQSPPFGGNLNEYQALFSQANWKKMSLEPCQKSIAPRLGTELFIHCQCH